MADDYVAFVFFRVLQDHLYDGEGVPVVEFPLHFDVLVRSEGEELSHDFAVEHGEGATLCVLDFGFCPSVLHDFSG